MRQRNSVGEILSEAVSSRGTRRCLGESRHHLWTLEAHTAGVRPAGTSVKGHGGCTFSTEAYLRPHGCCMTYSRCIIVIGAGRALRKPSRSSAIDCPPGELSRPHILVLVAPLSPSAFRLIRYFNGLRVPLEFIKLP